MKIPSNERLLCPGRSESLFATPEWFATWAYAFGGDEYGVWRASGPGRDLQIPYMRTSVAVAGIPIRSARAAQNFHSPRYDVIGYGATAADLARVMEDLDVNCVAFYGVPERSTLVEACSQFNEPANAPGEVFEEAPFVDCTLDWRAYWGSRGKNLRANLGAIERRLGDTRVEVLTLSEWRDIEPMIETIYEVEASGWKGARGSAIACDRAAKRFYDRLIRDFSIRGLIRLFILRIDAEIIAFELNTLYKGVLTGLKGGFRESYSKVSPGQLLRYRFLQAAFSNPEILCYDMLGPANETKLRWATGAEPLLTLRAFRHSAMGWLCRARLVTAPRWKEAVVRVAGRTRQHRTVAPC
jgi:hypothetical protein